MSRPWVEFFGPIIIIIIIIIHLGAESIIIKEG